MSSLYAALAGIQLKYVKMQSTIGGFASKKCVRNGRYAHFTTYPRSLLLYYYNNIINTARIIII